MGRPVVPIRQLDRRLPELGRIKDGVKVPTSNGKSERPKAIDTLRFTSQDPKALAQVAVALGGEVKPFSDPKSTDTHELLTPVAETPVILPPDPLGGTPMYELYDGGGRKHWCDGITCEQWRKGPEGPEPYEVACPCAEAGELSCRPTVHLSVILPFTRLGGTWRWTTHSYNAAVELPGMVEAIQSLQAKGLTRGVLRVDSRTQTIAGVTRHFKVPVLGVDATADELAAGQATLGALGSGTPVSIAPPAAAEIGAGEGWDAPSGSATTAPPSPEPERITPDEVRPPIAGGGAGAAQTDPEWATSSGVTVDRLKALMAEIPGVGVATVIRKANELAGSDAPTTIDAIEGELLAQLIDWLEHHPDRPPPSGGGKGSTAGEPSVPSEPSAESSPAEAPAGEQPADVHAAYKDVDPDGWASWNRGAQAHARGPKDRPGVLDTDKDVRDEQRAAIAFQVSRKCRGEGNEVTSWSEVSMKEARMISSTLTSLETPSFCKLVISHPDSPGSWWVERTDQESAA